MKLTLQNGFFHLVIKLIQQILIKILSCINNCTGIRNTTVNQTYKAQYYNTVNHNVNILYNHSGS